MISRDGNDTKEMYNHLLNNSSKKSQRELPQRLPSLPDCFADLGHILPTFEQPLCEKIRNEQDANLLQSGLTTCKKLIKKELEKLTQGKGHHFSTECKLRLKDLETPEPFFLGNESQPTNYQHFKKIFSLENSQFESLLNTYNTLVTQLNTLAKKQRDELIKSQTAEKNTLSDENKPRFGF